MMPFDKRRRKLSFPKPSRKRRRGTTQSRPVLEWLENRIVLSSYTVTSTGYSATTVGTLAYEIGQAISAVDTNAQIGFSVGNNSTISLNSSDFSTPTPTAIPPT